MTCCMCCNPKNGRVDFVDGWLQLDFVSGLMTNTKGGGKTVISKPMWDGDLVHRLLYESSLWVSVLG